MGIYYLILAANYIYLTGYGFDILPQKLMVESKILITSQTIFAIQTFTVLRQIYKSAYINRETEAHIKRFNDLRIMILEVFEHNEIYCEYYFGAKNGLDNTQEIELHCKS
jgi:hypothetical protein